MASVLLLLLLELATGSAARTRRKFLCINHGVYCDSPFKFPRMILALVTVSFAVSSDCGVGTGTTSVYLTRTVESWIDPIYFNKGLSLIGFLLPI